MCFLTYALTAHLGFIYHTFPQRLGISALFFHYLLIRQCLIPLLPPSKYQSSNHLSRLCQTNLSIPLSRPPYGPNFALPIPRLALLALNSCLSSSLMYLGPGDLTFRRPSSSPHLLRFGLFRFHSSLSCSYMPAAACRIPPEVAAGPELETPVDPFTVAAVAAIFRDAASRRLDLRQQRRAMVSRRK